MCVCMCLVKENGRVNNSSRIDSRYALAGNLGVV